MSRKLILNPFTALNQATLDTTANGEKTVCENLDAIAYDIVWANGSSLNAEAKIQYSNDDENWYDLDFGSTISLAGASGHHKIDVELIIFKYIRPRVEFAAGQADISIIAKGTTKGA